MHAPWQQWMPMYIQRLKSNAFVSDMSGAAKAGYLWLVMEQWQTDDCTIPNDVKSLRRMSGLRDEWESVAEEILERFQSLPGDRLQNKTCYELWMEAKAKYEEGQLAYQQLRELRSKRGKYGAQVKKEKKEAELKQDLSSTEAELKLNSSKTEAKSSLTDTVTVTETKDKELLASRPSGRSAVFMYLPTNRKDASYSVLDSHLAEWEKLYPGIDVRQQVRNMRGWLDGNPIHRKTLKGTPAFIHRWLGKAQDKATVPLPATGTQPKPFDPCTPKEAAPSGITSDQVEQWRRDKAEGKVIPAHAVFAVERIEKREARQ